MKYRIIYLILIFIYVLCGCSKPADTASAEKTFNRDSEVSTVSNKKEDAVSYEIVSQVVPPKDNSSVVKKELGCTSNTENNKPKEDVPSGRTSTNSDTASKETVSVNSNIPKDNNDTESTVTEVCTTSSEPIQVTEPNATKDDAKIIAEKMVEYINKYRIEQGTSVAKVLSGLAQYAEYRSRQLVFNFAHNTSDERAAATALKYGEYIDPKLFGSTGEPYYRANAREAILKAGYIGTVDDVAEKLALLVKNSSGHWIYVGSEEYKYIAIGVTYESGMWYSDIAVSTTDNYN